MIIITVSNSLLISVFFCLFLAGSYQVFRPSLMDNPILKPDGKRMTRSQALLMTTPLASPLTSPMISPVTAHKNKAMQWWWVPCLAVGCFLAGHYFRLPAASTNTKDPAKLAELADQATPLKPGPWGNLESIPLYIQPPDEYLPVKAVEESSPLWKFDGYSPALLSTLFDLADLTAEQKTELLNQSKWTVTSDGIVLSPSQELILSLSPHARKVIYAVLSQIPGNAIRNNRAYFPADKFDEYFSKSGLSPEIVELVRKLSFPHGRLLFFCDAPVVLAKLDNYEDKLRLMKVLSRKSTLLLRLHVMPDTDISALASYWG